MRAFSSPEAFGSFLRALGTMADDAAAKALREGAQLVAEDAKARIGHYEGNDWPQLADATQRERVTLGYSPNDPLLRTGALHDAIVADGQGREAVAGVKAGGGSPDIGDIAVWQELGTTRGIPPRPFLGPAGLAKGQEVADRVARAAADAFAGKL